MTKLALARYYEAIGEWMLPHVRARPLSLLRWSATPNEKGGTFLRHAKAWGPSALRRVQIQEKTKLGEYLVVDSTQALVALAQMDILEIHTWNSVVDDVEHPDRIVIDLDPAPDLPWKAVVDGALEVRRHLRARGLRSWIKTTGGKGLHVVVPLLPLADWDACLAFAREVAGSLSAEHPQDFLASMSKSQRTGRIFLDYLRNSRTSTSVAAYSIRAREGAPVSLPIRWEELDGLDVRALTMDVVLERLTTPRTRDPWRAFWATRQDLRPVEGHR